MKQVKNWRTSELPFLNKDFRLNVNLMEHPLIHQGCS